MKILLVHALSAEAKLIRNHFSPNRKLLSLKGTELFELNQQVDIVCAGLGLSRTEASLSRIPDPSIYSIFLQFGVSGSLSDDLPVNTLISAKSFSALNKEPIQASEAQNDYISKQRAVAFFSAQDAVMDEGGREVAISHGQAVDMESYAVAQFCADREIPLHTLRIISDRAGASTEEEFKANFKSASRILQENILEFILKG